MLRSTPRFSLLLAAGLALAGARGAWARAYPGYPSAVANQDSGPWEVRIVDRIFENGVISFYRFDPTLRRESPEEPMAVLRHKQDHCSLAAGEDVFMVITPETEGHDRGHIDLTMRFQRADAAGGENLTVRIAQAWDEETQRYGEPKILPRQTAAGVRLDPEAYQRAGAAGISRDPARAARPFVAITRR